MVMFGFGEFFIVWFSFFGGIGAPMGIVPGEEDPYLSQIAPEECLLYSSWSGTVVADPEKNVTEKWIAQKEMQTFWKKLFGELDRFAEKNVDNGVDKKIDPVFGDDIDTEEDKVTSFYEVRPILFRLAKISFTQPCAVVINRATEDGVSGNFVFKLGEWEDEIAADLDKINKEVLAKRGWGRETLHGMDVLVLKNVVQYQDDLVIKAGIHKGYLMVAFSIGEQNKPSFDEIFASEKTPEPKWLTEIKNELPIERRGSIAMVDTERWLELFENLASEMEFNPFEDVRKIGFITGIDGDGFLARTWIQTEGEPGAFFKVFEGGPLGAEELRAIPANQTLSTVSRLSPEQIYDGIKSIAASTGDEQEFDEMVAGFEGFSGMTLKEDLLEKIDDYGFLYADLGNIDLMGGSPPVVIGIGIKDEMAFLDTTEAFSLRIEEMVEENPDLEFESKKVDDIPVFVVTDSSEWGAFGEVCFAQVGSRLLISTDFKTLESHITNVENGKPEEMIFSQPEIKKLFEFGESIGCEGPTTILRFDTGKMIKRYWNMMAMFMGPGLMGPEADNFKFPKVPMADPMANGVTPQVSAIFKTKNGYQLYQRSVTPSSNIPTTVAAAMILGVTAQEIINNQ